MQPPMPQQRQAVPRTVAQARLQIAVMRAAIATDAEFEEYLDAWVAAQREQREVQRAQVAALEAEVARLSAPDLNV